MPGSNHSDRLAAKHEHNRQERLDGVKRWVEYIREQPPEVWGREQNRLVNTQLESARETNLSAEHEQRIREFAASASSATSDSSDE